MVLPIDTGLSSAMREVITLIWAVDQTGSCTFLQAIVAASSYVIIIAVLTKVSTEYSQPMYCRLLLLD